MSASDQPRDEARRQPANPADLRRYPPKGETCLRIRGLLRDYADDELEQPLRAAVELHAHDCRQCALALARSEHEVMRLRRMVADEAEVPRGFAASTVQRLLRELGSETSTGLRPPAPAAVAPDPQLPVLLLRNRRRLYTLALLSAAAAVLCVALLWRGFHEFERTACLVASTVQNVFDGRGKALEAGDEVRDGFGLRTRRDGSGAFQLLGPDGRRRGSIRVGGDTSLSMNQGAPTLEKGAFEVESGEPLTLALGDGTRIELGTGHYYIDASDYRAFDGSLDDQRGARPRVRVEVKSGDAARILRDRMAPETVGANFVASFQGFSAIDLEAAPTDPMLQYGLGGGPRVPAPLPQEVPALVGQVFEGIMGTTPAVGAGVTALFPRGNVPTLTLTTVDANGRFSVQADFAVSGDFVIVQVTPPPGRLDLGWNFVDALPVVRDFTGVRLPEPLLLSPSMAMAGAVTGPDQAPVVGVRVVPCVLDELFGLLVPLFDTAVSTDEVGNFVLQQLPTRLGPHQQLGVLLLHAERISIYSAIPLPGSEASRLGRLSFVLEPLQQVLIELPLSLGGRPVEIIEELRDVPAGTAVRIYSQRPAAVAVPFACGRGRMWLRTTANASQLVELKADEEPLLGTVYRLSSEPRVLASSVLRTLQPVDSTSRFQVATDFRQKDFSPAQHQLLRLQVVDEESRRGEARAQVFALGHEVGGISSVRFLGLYDGMGELGIGLAADEDAIVAIANDGRLVHRLIGPDASGSMTLLLQRCGSVVVEAGLRPAPSNMPQMQAIRFEPSGQPLQVGQVPFVRYAVAAEGWTVDRIPPGEYMVQIGERRMSVSIVSGGQVPLR